MKTTSRQAATMRFCPWARTMGRAAAVLACLFLLGVCAYGCSRRAPEPAPPVATPAPPATARVQRTAPPPGPSHIAFLLPMNGPYAPFARRILGGAHAARAHIAGAGIPLSISVVDTTIEDWQASFDALPPDVRLVGGPMRPEILAAALSSRGSRGRAVVAFMSELPEAVVSETGAARPIVEGRDAWRFFTSPEDNIRALLAGARAVGVTDLGVLYPEEPFGRRRAALFRRMAAAEGAYVATAGYAPNDPEQWARSTSRLLESGRADGRELGGVYIPDGWSKARMLIPNLLVQQKRRSLVLGSALWTQTQDVRNRDEALLFNRSVYPGAWWGENDANPARALRDAMAASGTREAGYWEALGFDFVRLAGRMADLPMYVPPEAVTAAFQRAAAMDWAMAPMRWNADGRASQDLYLFTPALYGPMRADLQALRGMLGNQPAGAAPPATPAASTVAD